MQCGVGWTFMMQHTACVVKVELEGMAFFLLSGSWCQ